MARRHVWLGAAIVLLLMTDVAMLYLRQGPAPVTEDLALDRFRSESAAAPDSATASASPSESVPAPTAASPSASASPSATPSPAPGTPPTAGPSEPAQPSGPQAPPPPAEGVYAYRTNGYERVAAFGGSRHDYPATTYMTVRRKGCGIVMRWQPLEERWDESDHCPEGPAITIERFEMYHEFFQQGEAQDYACDPGSHVYRAGQPAGTTWKVRCSSQEFGAIDMTTTVVGVESVPVEGTARQAVRMRYDAKITGYSQGTQVQERWIDQATGLMLRIITQVDVQTQTPLGPTAYEERYRIDLESIAPRT